MSTWLHAHPWVLVAAIIVLAVAAAVILTRLIIRVSRPHTGHHQAAPENLPGPGSREPEQAGADSRAGEPRVFVHPRQEAPLPDEEHRRDLLNDLTADVEIHHDVRSAWARQPVRHATAERPPWETAPHSRPLYAPEDLDALIASTPPSRSWMTAPGVAAGYWQPRHATASLPPWEHFPDGSRFPQPPVYASVAEDFPDPEGDFVRNNDRRAGDELAEEGQVQEAAPLLSQRLRQLLRRAPKNLPVAAHAAVPAAAPHVLAAGDGEPILEGIIVTKPDPDTWLRDQLNALTTWSTEQHAIQAAWRDQYLPAMLELAGAA